MAYLLSWAPLLPVEAAAFFARLDVLAVLFASLAAARLAWPPPRTPLLAEEHLHSSTGLGMSRNTLLQGVPQAWQDLVVFATSLHGLLFFVALSTQTAEPSALAAELLLLGTPNSTSSAATAAAAAVVAPLSAGTGAELAMAESCKQPSSLFVFSLACLASAVLTPFARSRPGLTRAARQHAVALHGGLAIVALFLIPSTCPKGSLPSSVVRVCAARAIRVAAGEGLLALLWTLFVF